MIVFANAKINVGLHVIAKRKDGFHNIESVFYPIPLKDIIEITKIGSSNFDYTFVNTGLSVDVSPRSNLCIKAFNLLKKDFKFSPIRIHLHKIIPFGAGLGGGSSDAVATIHGLNELFKLNLSDTDKINYALKLGSDCKFFLVNKPALVSGTGDKIESLKLNLSGYYIVLVKPDFSINTKEAYSGITPNDERKSIKNIIYQPFKMWKKSLSNDFEVSFNEKYTEIQSIKQKLYKLGALYSAMSGSGSSVYGLFKFKPNINKLFPKSYFQWVHQL